MKPDKSAPFNRKYLKENPILRSFLSRKGGVTDPTRTEKRWMHPVLASDRKPKTPIRQGGCCMRIKFTKWEKISRKGFAMMEIQGVRLEGDQAGQPWKHSIFSSAKEMASVVKDANSGDVLNVTMKKNGQYWNANKIVNETANGTAPAGNASAPTGTTAPVQSLVQSAPADPKAVSTNEVLGFYLKAYDSGIKKPDEIVEHFCAALRMSEMVDDWKENKGVFSLHADQEIPDAEDLDDLDGE